MTRSYTATAFALLAVGFLPIDSPIVWAALGAGAAMLGTVVGHRP